MKLLTFGVPCYNSQNYMEKCIDSLLTGGERVEIIIINDGSKDRTAEIADAYAEKYPSIVKVVHKENGGHGSGVNVGQLNASGLYYKVVDSDDWLDVDALAKLLDKIQEFLDKDENIDLFICNFVYEHISDNTSFVRNYRKLIPVSQVCSWDSFKKFKTSEIMLMHSLIYRTKALRDSNTILPEHTFYVDNIFAYKPLPYMNSIYYMDIDLYRYFIGRAEQSVNMNNFVKRYGQQINVMYEMIDCYSYDEIINMTKGLRKYMVHSLGVIMINTMMFTVSGDGKERKKEYKKLWNDLKNSDKAMYNKLRYRSYPTIVNFLPWKMRRFIMITGYKYYCKKIKIG